MWGGVPKLVNHAKFHQNQFISFSSLRGRNLPFSYAWRYGLYNNLWKYNTDLNMKKNSEAKLQISLCSWELSSRFPLASIFSHYFRLCFTYRNVIMFLNMFRPLCYLFVQITMYNTVERAAQKSILKAKSTCSRPSPKICKRTLVTDCCNFVSPLTTKNVSEWVNVTFIDLFLSYRTDSTDSRTI